MRNSTRENINSIKNADFKEGELAAIVEEYPYYSPAQFWLLSTYKKDLHKDFDKQAAVTGLFFNNPKWLYWQLFYQNNLAEKPINNVETFSSTESVSDEPESKVIIEEKNEEPESNVIIEDESEEPKGKVIIEDKSEEPIAFEPLYTVDYFASQGIKISNEALTNDKLGAQLKSFTEWLKSMKKIHSEKIAEGDEQTDTIIRHIAENSNKSLNVVTEAMAEVLLKQGKVEQTIEMYTKLSLNYPSRSAYFAEKIKSLKSV